VLYVYVTWQFDNCHVTYSMPLFDLIFTSGHYFVDPAHEMYYYSLKMAL